MNNARKVIASPSKKTFFLCRRFVIECGCTVIMAMPQNTCINIIPISISTHIILNRHINDLEQVYQKAVKKDRKKDGNRGISC